MEDGVSIDAQIAKGKANAEFRNLLLSDENIFIDDGVSAKAPLWSRPAATDEGIHPQAEN